MLLLWVVCNFVCVNPFLFGFAYLQLDEGERNDLNLRFRREGLTSSLSDDKKLPHVWRWLSDAESNCMSLRNQIDKLYKQQEADIKVSTVAER